MRPTPESVAAPEEHEPGVRGGFVLNVVPAILWTGVIFVGGSSGMPQPQVDVGLPFDKVNHVIAFLGLHLLCYRAIRYGAPERGHRAARWLAVLLAVVIGGLLELYQLGLPDRSAELGDVLADSVGAVIGALGLGLVARRRSGAQRA
jgi:VanZ family protein